MFISKKRWQALIKRVADLEGQVQSQQKDICESKVVLDGKLLRTSARNSPFAM